MTNVTAMLPAADHQVFVPRPLPADWESASINAGACNRPLSTSCRAQSFVLVITGVWHSLSGRIRSWRRFKSYVLPRSSGMSGTNLPTR